MDKKSMIAYGGVVTTLAPPPATCEPYSPPPMVCPGTVPDPPKCGNCECGPNPAPLFPAIDKHFLLDLYNDGKITAEGQIRLSRPFSFADLEGLYDNGDINTPDAFIALSGRKPCKPAVQVSNWFSSPELPVTVALAFHAARSVALQNWVTEAVYKDLRPKVTIEWAPGIYAETSTFSFNDTGIAGGALDWAPDNGTTSDSAVSSNKRTWTVGGNINYMQTLVDTVSNAAGKFRYRYIVEFIDPQQNYED